MLFSLPFPDNSCDTRQTRTDDYNCFQLNISLRAHRRLLQFKAREFHQSAQGFTRCWESSTFLFYEGPLVLTTK